MPNMNGEQSTRAIRDALKHQSQPYIVALTADVQTTVKQSCFQSGMNDFLGKPFKQRELDDVMSRAKNSILKNKQNL